ncbi:PTS system mannose/fructose/N-acetylgalactosamine-transporter subunit IIB [Enterococcus raffinosus]|uniref:PTS sugar transporter subunit IIB n=1 Tax=Enterococcus raffinosus TaxID=71452 RepID=A0AAW8T8Y3_9ENTE|nr:PTS sugar transporter subunit IIB [Enterococcus raffinosus]MDT2543195.1 PTS sugar transporter subunit IIB [Enterococcus raffinosus]
MAKIKLVRIDSRLIHGQVITKWIPITAAKQVIIIDDDLSQDEFMGDIYASAAPRGGSCRVISVADAVKSWQQNQFGEGNTMILFQNIENCYKAFKEGLPFKNLQLGEIPMKKGRVTVFKAISFNKEEALKLKEVMDSGVEIILQPVPELSKVEFKKTLKKFDL